MKLSKAQETVMEDAKRQIDEAQSMDYPEWLKHGNGYYEDHEDAWNKAVAKCYLKEYWEEHRNGIVLTHCNSRTLAKLEEYGLIKIIEDSKGEQFGIDTVQILNY